MLGYGGAVAAQQRRQIPCVGEPGARRRRRREHPPAQVWHRHHLPLQALGGVHGEDLHPVVGDGHLGGCQAVLHLHGSIQIREQTRHRRARPGGEVGHHVGERVQVLGARPSRCHWPGRPNLGVDAEHPAHLGDEVGQRVRQMGAQRGQLAAERDDPAVPGRGIRLRRPGIADRVGQAGRVGVGGGLRDDLLGGGVVRRPVIEFDGASPQRGDVATTQSPPRPAQHLHRGGSCGGIGHQTQRRHHVGNLGHGEQPGETDDLDGDAACRKRVGHRRGIGVAAHQHRRRRCGRTVAAGAVIHPRQMVCDPIPFGRHVGQQRAPDDARLGVGPRPQCPHRDRTAPRLGGHRVRQMQRPRRIAPAGAQLQRGRRRSVRPREIGGEPRQVGRRRAPPSVDRLDRIADGRQSQVVVDASAKQ